MQFALATSLTTALRVLEVDLLRDWDIGHSETWGKVGHYKIAAKACELVSDPALRTLLLANQANIAVTDADILNGNLPSNNQAAFVALADVPDLIWRSKRRRDAANHFADLDAVVEAPGPLQGKSLASLFDEDAQSLSRDNWLAVYSALGHDAVKEQGALPFRVWEFYNEMVDAVAHGDVLRFVAAAGVSAHYVGDAVQPLHVSHLHHGRPGHDGEDRVHSVYETNMLDRMRAEVLAGVNGALAGSAASQFVGSGSEAAQRVTELMIGTLNAIEPLEVIDAFNAEEGSARIQHMWDMLGPRTVQRMVAGSLALAELWESAWRQGNGAAISPGQLGKMPQAGLMDLYNNRDWVEARWLRNITVG